MNGSAETPSRPPLKLMLVGPSTRFLSGIAYYTYSLAGGLAPQVDLSVLLIRRLVPQRLYPGGARVGQDLSALAIPEGVPVYDGIDYFWGPSLVGMIRFLRRQRPEVLVLQWWTGTVLHTYLLLGLLARWMGIPMVLEFHESLDPAEQSLPALAAYVRVLAPRLFSMCSGFVVHSEFDREALGDRYGLDPETVTVMPHATYAHTRQGGRLRSAPDSACNLLFFGLIRPVKGLDFLLDAVESLQGAERERFWLTIVGETWEGCEPLVDRARTGAFADRTTIVNRYVSDSEADAYFGGADALVLPYRSSSQSGVFHMATAYGLPIVVADVGGLGEAARAYERAIVVKPESPEALVDGFRQIASATARPASPVQSWFDSGTVLRRVGERVVASSRLTPTRRRKQ